MRLNYIILLISFLVSCEKEKPLPFENETDPKILIQGKWEIEAIGNGEDLRPYPASAYKEYYQDSLIRVFDYETDTFLITSVKYEINDSLLYENVYYPSIDETLTTIYYYNFFENNQKLRLDYKNLYAINNSFIYRRIYFNTDSDVQIVRIIKN